MPTTAKEFDDFADALRVERGVRSLFIVGASKVDDLLLEILRAYYLPKLSAGKNEDELLEGDKCTFSTRIKMCRRLGLIDETLYLSLERLRTIRNKSAHAVAFDHAVSPLSEHFSEFRKSLAGRSSYSLTKKRYFDDDFASPVEEWQCMLLTICVLLEAVRTNTVPTKGNARSLRISAR
jgi:hypothetical protein